MVKPLSREKLQNETNNSTGVDVEAVLSRMKKAFKIESDDELGYFLGVAPNKTFKVWKNRKAIPQSYFAKVAEETGETVGYLKTGMKQGMAALFQDETKSTRAEKTNHHVAESHATYAPEGFILVPRYEVQASAGNGSLVHSEQIVDYLAFKADWVRNTLGVAQKDLALISVKGDSMEPGLSNEDLILIDMRKNRVEDNAIYVLQLNDALLVKRIQRKLDGTLHVMSDNPYYEIEVVSAERVPELHVLGRVVWSGRRM
jgi:phage repressor protein C with HTH and peptisase S24 domain